MSDIVERLLEWGEGDDGWVKIDEAAAEVCCAAAAEITRLRDELANCRAAALDEAAKVAERLCVLWDGDCEMEAEQIAAAIRALSPSPAAPLAKCCHKTVLAHCDGCPYIPVKNCGCFRCSRALSPSPAAPSSPVASDQSEPQPGSTGRG